MAVGVLSTDPFHGYSVVFSPFTGDKLAVVGGLNYGIAGPGGLIVYQIDRQAPPGGIARNNGGYNQWRRYIVNNTGAATINVCGGYSGTIGRMCCLTLPGASYMNLF